MTVTGTTSASMDDASDAITRDRLEQKYRVERRQARPLSETLDGALERHVHADGEAQALPGAQQFATTVYFDTPSGDVLRRATSGGADLKLRAREYYTFHPAFTQLATDPSQLVRFDPAVWLEIKLRDGDAVRKERLRIPKREIPAFFSDGLISSDMVDLQRPAFGDDAQRTLKEIADVCRQFDESLRAVSIVNYQRLAWQNPESTLRVTLDREIAFYRAPRDLWERNVAMTRAALGPPARTFGACILEIKARTELPSWLDSLLSPLGPPPPRLSKFVLASQALHD